MVRKAFLSSTGKDLAPHREAVADAISGLDEWKCVRMEEFGARARLTHEFCAEAIAGCDLFVGIVGHCYGSIPAGHESSYTEQEYDAACALDLPRLMFVAPAGLSPPAGIIEPPEHRRRLAAFRARVEGEQLCAPFDSASDLANRVLQAIRNWEAGEKRKLAVPVATGQVATGQAAAGLGDHAIAWGSPPWLLPRYLEELVSVALAPKRFVAQRTAAGTLTFERAAVFWAISLVLSLLISIAMTSETPLVSFLQNIVLFTIVTVGYGTVVTLSWRVVGTRVATRRLFPIHLYYSGVFLLLFHACMRIFDGFVRAFDPQLFSGYREAIRSGQTLDFILTNQMASTTALVPIGLLAIAINLVFLAWLIAGWGAFRRLAGASRARSALAFVVFLVLSLAAYAVVFFLASAFDAG